MEENIRLLAMDRNVGRGAFGDWIWWCCDILVVLVVFERLGGIGPYGLQGVNQEVCR
jgi:hypothetical protein